MFDDTILDKNFSHRIELIRRQYSGNAHGIVKGIGVVTCVYVNPDTGEHWVIDYRIYDPQGDGLSKLDHVRDMLLIESMGKICYCPLKSNRLVDDSGGALPYQHVDALDWSERKIAHGKLIKIKGFPKEHKVKLFRVAVSTHRADMVVTNDLTQNVTRGAQQACALRWKIEQFHREAKQLTGIERCQSRKARIQRNHIACAMLVWVRLAAVARNTGQTLYRVKHGLLEEFLRQQLKNPVIPMRLA